MTPRRTQRTATVIGSGIAKGRILSIDVVDAEAAPGVLAIVTAKTAGDLGQGRSQHGEASGRA